MKQVEGYSFEKSPRAAVLIFRNRLVLEIRNGLEWRFVVFISADFHRLTASPLINTLSLSTGRECVQTRAYRTALFVSCSFWSAFSALIVISLSAFGGGGGNQSGLELVDKIRYLKRSNTDSKKQQHLSRQIPRSYV